MPNIIFNIFVKHNFRPVLSANRRYLGKGLLIIKGNRQIIFLILGDFQAAVLKINIEQ